MRIRIRALILSSLAGMMIGLKPLPAADEPAPVLLATRENGTLSVVVLDETLDLNLPGFDTVPVRLYNCPFWNLNSIPAPLPTISLLPPMVLATAPDSTIKIPVSQIKKIVFASRSSKTRSDDIATAINALGSVDATKQQAAVARLMLYKELAFADLQKAAKDIDINVALQAAAVIKKLQDTYAADLQVRKYDAITTADGRTLLGTLQAPTLHVSSPALPSSQSSVLKLQAEFVPLTLQAGPITSLGVEQLSSLNTSTADPLDGMALAPLNLTSYDTQVGQTLTFKVTGAAPPAPAPATAAPATTPATPNPLVVVLVKPAGPATGNIWGTDVYSTDSELALVAVHAGILKVGQTGLIRVQIVGTYPAFAGSVTKNTDPKDAKATITSTSRGTGLAFKVLK